MKQKNKFFLMLLTMLKMKKLEKNFKIYYFPLLKIRIKKVEIFKNQLKDLKMMKTINLLTH